MAHSDLSALVTDAAAQVPDRRALVEFGGRSLTWAELESEVARLAWGLDSRGLRAGQRVMIAVGNRLEFVTAYLAVLRAQLVAVPVNPRSSVGELARMIADSGSRMVIADGTCVEQMREALALLNLAQGGAETGLDPEILSRAMPCQLVVVDAATGEGEVPFGDLRADRPGEVPLLPDSEKLGVLLYTSGTSGLPRAAMLTHRALLANIEQAGSVEPAMIHGDDVVLGVLPLFHVYGLNAVLGGVLRHRAKLLLVEQWDPQAVLDLIEDEACSVLPVAPPVFNHWLREPNLREQLGPVRLVLSGSAPLAPEIIEAFELATGIPVHQGYGLTEASPVVTSTLCSEHLQAGSVGAALPGVEIRLTDAHGRAVEGEDPGEIDIRGANLFSGYWPDGADGPDQDGWWATGDVGFLDATGDLFLVDRVKELVIVSGFNVYPSEVEEVLSEVEGVAEVAVIGVPDEETGEAVVAYVVASGVGSGVVTGAGSGGEGDIQARLVEHAAGRLARFKRPSRIEIVSELPLTVTGKVQKGRLRGIERRKADGLLE